MLFSRENKQNKNIMKQYKLSICIPARSEEFLKNTVEDILKNKEAETEIIVGLDGKWSDPPLIQHPDVNIIYVPEAIGQRAMVKLCAKLSTAKYIAKCDAHCSFDEGFDRKMLESFEKTGDNVALVPIMRNLHAFSWKCMKCGNKWYQGPTPTECKETNYKNTNKPCDSKKFKKKLMWIGKHNPQSTSYCFDKEPHFQYFEDWKHRPQYIKDKAEKGITETMSLQGSFYMMTREKYFALDIDDENLGSWGNQGLTVASKVWLSGGKVLVIHSTWYSHLFRTQGGDFSFPYEQRGRDVQRTKANVRKQIWLGKLIKQKYPLSWLVEKFAPVPGWSAEDIVGLKEQEKKNAPLLESVK